ncbi:hypothetical protein F5884DRAFT_241811 [Xylogone sp. PMI_703]|nr:hypothetical protein F5884DRAFT_241811 [Xylogone sp. PMI_703]
MATNNGTTYSESYLGQSRATVLNTFYAIPIGLELISTALRIWTKVGRRQDARLAFDDYLMIFATIVAIAECISGLVYGAPFGLGRHIQALTPHDLEMYMLGDYIFSHFYDVAIGCTKLSVLALYYRVFSPKKVFRAVIVCTGIFVIAWVIVMEVGLGFSCRPIQAFWGAAEGTCINLVAFTYFTNVTNLVADLWIFAMPIPVILGLQASRDKKISLCFLFSIGLGTCAISAARLSFVFGVGSTDYTWYETNFGILSAWEPCGGILCANLPVVYSSVVRVIKKVTSSVHRSEQRTKERTTYDEPSGRRVGHGWSQLNKSGSLARNSSQATDATGLTAKEAQNVETELATLDVERTMIRDTSRDRRSRFP